MNEVGKKSPTDTTRQVTERDREVLASEAAALIERARASQLSINGLVRATQAQEEALEEARRITHANRSSLDKLNKTLKGKEVEVTGRIKGVMTYSDGEWDWEYVRPSSEWGDFTGVRAVFDTAVMPRDLAVSSKPEAFLNQMEESINGKPPPELSGLTPEVYLDCIDAPGFIPNARICVSIDEVALDPVQS